MTALMKEFDNHIAGIAWSLWNELGIPATDRFHESCLVQLEELIILTVIISKHDPRLRDEALDWASKYHELISVTRLRTLLKETDANTMIVFSQFAAVLNSISTAKWPNAADSISFRSTVSGKSLLPPLESPSLLMLRLRSLFSPGVKADILTYFLTRNVIQCAASDLVDIGYSKRSIMTALDLFTASGIMAVRNIRNMKLYALKKPKELQVIIGKLPRVAPPWNKILQAIIALRNVIPEIQNSSPTTRNVIFRNCLTEIEPLLPTFISPLLNYPPDFENDWKALMGIFNAFQQGNFMLQYQVYNDFDKVVVNLLQYLYRVDDCTDGIEQVLSDINLKPQMHAKKYKECYQLFLSFVQELEISLKQFLEFPFHKLMDEDLTDIPYQFTREKLSLVIEKINSVKAINEISDPQSAIRQYRLFTPELEIVRQFMNTLRKKIEELYFIRTNVHLLTLPDTLYKRHLVRELFL